MVFMELDVDMEYWVMGKSMKENFNKYWGDLTKMNMVLFVASILF